MTQDSDGITDIIDYFDNGHTSDLLVTVAGRPGLVAEIALYLIESNDTEKAVKFLEFVKRHMPV